MTSPHTLRILAGALVFSACVSHPARGQEPAEPHESTARKTKPAEAAGDLWLAERGHKENERTGDTENKLGGSLVRNIVLDQKAIWTSPSRLRWADGSWLFPVGAVTAGFFLSDRSAVRALSNDPNHVRRYKSLSNYGLASLVGAGGGLYLWSKISHDDHQRETGILAAEAAINGLAVNTMFKYAWGRERPYQDTGRGRFFQGGTSFASDHAVAAWSIASVIAHEYPGPLTKFTVYGMAAAVSASRVMGKQHAPSDVVVGSLIGWLIGRQVYRRHHDTGLGGAGWDSFSGNEDVEGQRDRRNMGSTFVPLDSWVYAAFERLAGFRVVHTAMLGLKPWTRIECARLTREAGEALKQGGTASEEAAGLHTRLQQEFGYELVLLDGGRNLTAKLESVYVRAVSISGPPLTDSYHFGQTVSYDFGRPFERGMNGQVGGSFRAAAGPVAIYVRAEYQHAPGAPAASDAARNAIAASDAVSLSSVPAGPVAVINRPRLLDAYATVNLRNWQLVIGKQSLSWAPGPDGSMLWSNNSEPVDMVRLVNPEPFYLPSFLRHLGPVRIDSFFGRLGGYIHVQRPFEYGSKINLKPFSILELGFGRTVTIGGKNSGEPLTVNRLVRSFFGLPGPPRGSVPGDNHAEMDWTIYVPKVRNYIVFYGDAFAEDDVLPFENPGRNPWHAGVYITRIPRLPKLDFHMDGVSTEQEGLVGGGNVGRFNYWNDSYRDGYTNNGNLIGNVVGREGRTFRCWFTYWISPGQTLRFTYKHNSVNADFIPQGGAWQDYAVNHEIHLRSGFYAKSFMQVEHIQHFPVLFKGSVNNVTAAVELGFDLKLSKP